MNNKRKNNDWFSMVTVDWSKRFAVKNVKQIIEVVKDQAGFGYIRKSVEVPQSVLDREYFYKNGDVYMVSESLGSKSLHHLVQIDADTELGIRPIASFDGTDDVYESNMVNKLIEDSRLQSNIRVIF